MGLFDKKSKINVKKIQLKRGFTYLVYDEHLQHTYTLLKRYINVENPGFCVTRTFPEKIRRTYKLGETPIIWLSNTRTEESVKPKDLEQIYSSFEKYLINEGSIGLLDGVEYLIANNNYITVLKFIQSLRDQVAINKSILLLSINPSTIDSHQINLLEREVDYVIWARTQLTNEIDAQEKEWIEKERLERLEKEEFARIRKENLNNLEKKRLDIEKQEREREEKERLEKEKQAENERLKKLENLKTLLSSALVVPPHLESNTTAEIVVQLHNTTPNEITQISVDFSDLESDFGVEGTIKIDRLRPNAEIESFIRIKPRYLRGTFPVKIVIWGNGVSVEKEYTIKVGGTEIY
jgi:hypothetical protein